MLEFGHDSGILKLEQNTDSKMGVPVQHARSNAQEQEPCECSYEASQSQSESESVQVLVNRWYAHCVP